MRARTAMAVLFVASLLCPPAAADRPAGPAAQILTHTVAEKTGDPFCFGPHFQWLEDFGGANIFEAGDTLTFGFAIVPFRGGISWMSLNTGGLYNSDFVTISFHEGLVAGVPYDRFRWNDVSVEVRFASQDYVVTVNGATSAPVRMPDCEGGCFAVSGWGFGATEYAPGAGGWLDTVTLVGRRAATGEEVGITGVTFDPCYTGSPMASGGGVLFADPPARLGR